MVKNLPANAGDPREAASIHGSGRAPGGGNGDPHQSSSLEIPWTEETGATVHGIAQTGSSAQADTNIGN